MSKFGPMPDTDATMFIQWKNTNLCMDFYCECGADLHFDGMFAYNVRCPHCGAVYELGTQVHARKTDDSDARLRAIHPTQEISQ